MVMDHLFPHDALFLVFEEDYRFWPEGEDHDDADDYKARLEIRWRRRTCTGRLSHRQSSKIVTSVAIFLPSHGGAGGNSVHIAASVFGPHVRTTAETGSRKRPETSSLASTSTRATGDTAVSGLAEEEGEEFLSTSPLE